MPDTTHGDAEATAKADADARQFWNIVLWVVVAVLVVVVAVSTARKVRKDRHAFLRFRAQTAQVLDGVNVYGGKSRFSYLPIFAVLLYPLAVLPPYLGAAALFVIKVAMVVAAVRWSMLMASGNRRGPPPWVVLIVVLLCARPLISDLQHGNVNIIIMFLVIGGLRLLTRGRSLAAGMLIGLSVALKVTPALFLPYLAYKRRWRALSGCGVGIVLSVALPALFLGPARNLELHKHWYKFMIAPYAKEGAVKYQGHINQSVSALSMRLLTDSEGVYMPKKIHHKTGTHRPINVMSLDPAGVKGVTRVIMLGIVAWLAFVCRTRWLDARDWRLPCEFSLVLIAMLMLSAWTWKHHFVTIVLPMACVVTYLLFEAPGRGMRRYVTCTLIGFALLTTAMSGDLIGWMYRVEGERVAHKFVEAFGSYFLAGALLFAVLSVVLLRHRGAGTPHQP